MEKSVEKKRGMIMKGISMKIYLKVKETVKQSIYQSIKEGNEQFEKKENEDVNRNRMLF